MRFSLKKFFKRMAFTLLALILIVAIGTVVVLNLPSFGKLPSGERLARIEQSPNYREGHFQNLSETPDQGLSFRSFIITFSLIRRTYIHKNPCLRYKRSWVCCPIIRGYGSGIPLT